ncbi:flagellar protein FlgA [Bifidobacterium sp. DSM 109958]|uniref:Flagellar protein FlgA n=1 Tax=Bifidobacterium moraviense TaxID=2675323 RepID=A0A7Y0F193_9BIFI|nr:SAF domain-containing protein [Bifidobacterium sp. DSM 109958]NMN00170.1 flagellar protein FlgA [Bifidobacterium sp. DSM 109958]
MRNHASRLSSLARRRLDVAARRWIAACCAALAVLCALGVVDALVRRQTVVVAAADIARGARLDGDSLAVAEVPVSPVTQSAAARVEDVRGMIALAPIARGQPLYPAMLSAAPVPESGSTTIEVRLASVPERLTPGDRVDLVSSVGCEAVDAAPSDAAPADGGADVDADATARSASGACVLARDALTMTAPAAAAETGASGLAGSGLLSGSGSGVSPSLSVTFALGAEDALRVLAGQEAGPLLAVLRAPSGSDEP